MSENALITFKAGICDLDTSDRPVKVKARTQPGYIYLFSDDDLLHFCWRPRDVPHNEPELDLVMIPNDAHFEPYEPKSDQPTSKTNGRIFVLKFQSSNDRHLFWLQSKPQGRSGNPAWLSPRDRKIGEIVDKLLQGEQVNITSELASVQNNNDDDEGPQDDGDERMEGVEGPGHDSNQGTGGAGADATGGDVREEGEDAREGGADGARAASGDMPADAAAAVRNFLESLKGAPGFGSVTQPQGKLYPLLNDLLEAPVTLAMIEQASDEYVDNLLSLLPPTVIVLQQRGGHAASLESEPTPADAAAAQAVMTSEQKRATLKMVLRSPQFHQSLTSLTMAIRDGGLPTVSEALGIKVENGGLVRGGTMPLGGGEAVEAFVEGVKKTVQEKK